MIARTVARLAVFCATLFTVPIAASPPAEVGYQGLLVLSDGLAPDGSYEIKFSIFASHFGGVAVWTQTHTSVEVHSGVFDVTLGPSNGVDPADALAVTGPGYLELSVNRAGTWETLSPRQPLGVVARAAFALEADQALGSASPQSAIAEVPSGLVILWVESQECPEGFEPLDSLSSEGGPIVDGRGQFVVGATQVAEIGTASGGAVHGHAGNTTLVKTNGNCPAPSTITALVAWGGDAHRHAYATPVDSFLPPYVTVVYCRKK